MIMKGNTSNTMDFDSIKSPDNDEIEFTGGLSGAQGLLITANANLAEARSLRAAAARAVANARSAQEKRSASHSAKVLLDRAAGLEREAQRLYRMYQNSQMVALKESERKKKEELIRKQKEQEKRKKEELARLKKEKEKKEAEIRAKRNK